MPCFVPKKPFLYGEKVLGLQFSDLIRSKDLLEIFAVSYLLRLLDLDLLILLLRSLLLSLPLSSLDLSLSRKSSTASLVAYTKFQDVFPTSTVR